MAKFVDEQRARRSAQHHQERPSADVTSAQPAERRRITAAQILAQVSDGLDR